MNVSFRINGKRVSVDVPPNETLVETLRERLGLTGTKASCKTGECGSCTVLLNGKSVCSCLLLTVEAEGSKIETIEGLSEDGVLHPLQEAFIEEDAIQCGYCTPGMIMASLSLLNKNPNPSIEEIERAIEGNMCRCGTHIKVVKAVKKAAEWMRKSPNKQQGE